MTSLEIPKGNVKYDTSNDLFMTNPDWQNTKIFVPEAVMTISKDGVWVNPNMTVDEAATAVIAVLGKHIKALVNRQPLSVQEIDAINKSIDKYIPIETAKVMFARKIEAAHGIGVEE